MEILRIAVLGGVLSLDGTSVGQVMLSRPLVTGALVGALLGDIGLGISIGVILELYLIVSFPTGGAAFPEGATAAVVAVASTAGLQGAGALPVGVAIGLVWGQVGGQAITALRHLNARLVPESDDVASTADRVTWTHLAGIAMDFGRGAILSALGAAAGRAVAPQLVAAWPLGPDQSRALLFVGAAASLGILLRDLGGMRKRGLAFVAGLALGVLGLSIS